MYGELEEKIQQYMNNFIKPIDYLADNNSPINYLK